LLNIQHSQTTTYHLQSNGMVERFHRRLKDALRARCTAANWVDHLPLVLLGLPAAAREDNGTTPHLSFLQKFFLSNFLRH
jgi:transposase InsO family protein